MSKVDYDHDHDHDYDNEPPKAVIPGRDPGIQRLLPLLHP